MAISTVASAASDSISLKPLGSQTGILGMPTGYPVITLGSSAISLNPCIISSTPVCSATSTPTDVGSGTIFGSRAIPVVSLNSSGVLVGQRAVFPRSSIPVPISPSTVPSPGSPFSVPLRSPLHVPLTPPSPLPIRSPTSVPHPPSPSISPFHNPNQSPEAPLNSISSNNSVKTAGSLRKDYFSILPLIQQSSGICQPNKFSSHSPVNIVFSSANDNCKDAVRNIPTNTTSRVLPSRSSGIMQDSSLIPIHNRNAYSPRSSVSNLQSSQSIIISHGNGVNVQTCSLNVASQNQLSQSSLLSDTFVSNSNTSNFSQQVNSSANSLLNPLNVDSEISVQSTRLTYSASIHSPQSSLPTGNGPTKSPVLPGGIFSSAAALTSAPSPSQHRTNPSPVICSSTTTGQAPVTQQALSTGLAVSAPQQYPVVSQSGTAMLQTSNHQVLQIFHHPTASVPAGPSTPVQVHTAAITTGNLPTKPKQPQILPKPPGSAIVNAANHPKIGCNSRTNIVSSQGLHTSHHGTSGTQVLIGQANQAAVIPTAQGGALVLNQVIPGLTSGPVLLQHNPNGGVQLIIRPPTPGTHTHAVGQTSQNKTAPAHGTQMLQHATRQQAISSPPPQQQQQASQQQVLRLIAQAPMHIQPIQTATGPTFIALPSVQTLSYQTVSNLSTTQQAALTTQPSRQSGTQLPLQPSNILPTVLNNIHSCTPPSGMRGGTHSVASFNISVPNISLNTPSHARTAPCSQNTLLSQTVTGSSMTNSNSSFVHQSQIGDQKHNSGNNLSNSSLSNIRRNESIVSHSNSSSNVFCGTNSISESRNTSITTTVAVTCTLPTTTSISAATTTCTTSTTTTTAAAAASVAAAFYTSTTSATSTSVCAAASPTPVGISSVNISSAGITTPVGSSGAVATISCTSTTAATSTTHASTTTTTGIFTTGTASTTTSVTTATTTSTTTTLAAPTSTTTITSLHHLEGASPHPKKKPKKKKKKMDLANIMKLSGIDDDDITMCDQIEPAVQPVVGLCSSNNNQRAHELSQESSQLISQLQNSLHTGGQSSLRFTLEDGAVVLHSTASPLQRAESQVHMQSNSATNLASLAYDSQQSQVATNVTLLQTQGNMTVLHAQLPQLTTSSSNGSSTPGTTLLALQSALPLQQQVPCQQSTSGVPHQPHLEHPNTLPTISPSLPHSTIPPQTSSTHTSSLQSLPIVPQSQLLLLQTPTTQYQSFPHSSFHQQQHHQPLLQHQLPNQIQQQRVLGQALSLKSGVVAAGTFITKSGSPIITEKSSSPNQVQVGTQTLLPSDVPSLEILSGKGMNNVTANNKTLFPSNNAKVQIVFAPNNKVHQSMSSSSINTLSGKMQSVYLLECGNTSANNTSSNTSISTSKCKLNDGSFYVTNTKMDNKNSCRDSADLYVTSASLCTNLEAASVVTSINTASSTITTTTATTVAAAITSTTTTVVTTSSSIDSVALVVAAAPSTSTTSNTTTTTALTTTIASPIVAATISTPITAVLSITSVPAAPLTSTAASTTTSATSLRNSTASNASTISAAAKSISAAAAAAAAATTTTTATSTSTVTAASATTSTTAIAAAAATTASVAATSSNTASATSTAIAATTSIVATASTTITTSVAGDAAATSTTSAGGAAISSSITPSANSTTTTSPTNTSAAASTTTTTITAVTTATSSSNTIDYANTCTTTAAHPLTFSFISNSGTNPVSWVPCATTSSDANSVKSSYCPCLSSSSSVTGSAVTDTSVNPTSKNLGTAAPVSPPNNIAVNRGLKRSATSPLYPTAMSWSNIIEQQLKTDQSGASLPDTKSAFTSASDACKRLIRYHVFNEKVLTQQDLEKADEFFEATAKHLLDKFHQMMNKYHYLLLMESTREVNTSELVMIDRMFVSEEHNVLEQLKEDERKAKENCANQNGEMESNGLPVTIKMECDESHYQETMCSSASDLKEVRIMVQDVMKNESIKRELEEDQKFIVVKREKLDLGDSFSEIHNRHNQSTTKINQDYDEWEEIQKELNVFSSGSKVKSKKTVDSSLGMLAVETESSSYNDCLNSKQASGGKSDQSGQSCNNSISSLCPKLAGTGKQLEVIHNSPDSTSQDYIHQNRNTGKHTHSVNIRCGSLDEPEWAKKLRVVIGGVRSKCGVDECRDEGDRDDASGKRYAHGYFNRVSSTSGSDTVEAKETCDSVECMVRLLPKKKRHKHVLPSFVTSGNEGTNYVKNNVNENLRVCVGGDDDEDEEDEDDEEEEDDGDDEDEEEEEEEEEEEDDDDEDDDEDDDDDDEDDEDDDEINAQVQSAIDSILNLQRSEDGVELISNSIVNVSTEVSDLISRSDSPSRQESDCISSENRTFLSKNLRGDVTISPVRSPSEVEYCGELDSASKGSDVLINNDRNVEGVHSQNADSALDEAVRSILTS